MGPHKALGFDTINIDAGSLDRNPATGKLFGNTHRFPSGLRNLSDFLHAASFTFGAYNDISGHTCGSGGWDTVDHMILMRRFRRHLYQTTITIQLYVSLY